MGVIVYTKDNCQQCKATCRQLDSMGVDYEVRDALENADMLLSMGFRSAPVVMVDGGKSWCGYRPSLLSSIGH